MIPAPTTERSTSSRPWDAGCSLPGCVATGRPGSWMRRRRGPGSKRRWEPIFSRSWTPWTSTARSSSGTTGAGVPPASSRRSGPSAAAASSRSAPTTSRTSRMPIDRRRCRRNIDTGTSGTSTPSAVARASSRTGAPSAGCSGSCGRRRGRSTMRRSTEQPPASTTPTSWTSSSTRTVIDTGRPPGDPALEWIERRLAELPPIVVPTVVLHGAADAVTPPTAEAEDAGRFLGPYERHVVPNAGHLLPREAPDAIVAAIKALIG